MRGVVAKRIRKLAFERTVGFPVAMYQFNKAGERRERVPGLTAKGEVRTNTFDMYSIRLIPGCTRVLIKNMKRYYKESRIKGRTPHFI